MKIHNILSVNSATREILNLLHEENVSRLMLIRGKDSFFKCGANRLIESLRSEINIQIFNFFDFSVNPKEEDVKRGACHLKNFEPDAMIAIGGGSVIDMAKLIKYYSRFSSLPIIAIPTTSGTGSEETSFAVCYINGVKHSIASSNMLPKNVFLIPDFTINNNLYLTNCSGFDAFAQAMEAYWNINATEESDSYAFFAINILYKNLNSFVDNYNTRANLMIGSNLAGKAINITKTTAPHALSYTITSKFGYPHGHAVALTFPFFCAININCKKNNYAGNDYEMFRNKMQMLLNVFGLSDIDDIQKFMINFVRRIGLSYDIKKPITADVVKNGINIERARNNPHIINKKIVKEAVESIFVNN